MLSQAQYVELATNARKWAQQYYLYPDFGETEVDDYTYDMAYRRLAKYEGQYPEHVHPLSPVGKVSGGVYDV